MVEFNEVNDLIDLGTLKGCAYACEHCRGTLAYTDSCFCFFLYFPILLQRKFPDIFAWGLFELGF